MAKLVGDKGEYERRVEQVADMIIALVDDDGDGMVTAANWGVFYNIYGIDTAPSAVVARLDRNKDGKVDRSEILTALREYFYSADPAAPGNWFYGDWQG
jgi:hypothetical protein